MNLFLGIDFGTSGARSVVIDTLGGVHAEGVCTWKESLVTMESPKLWKNGLFELLNQIPKDLCSQIRSIAINGTSATVLLCDEMGNPVTAPLAYNHSCDQAIVERLKAIAPPDNPVLSSTSSLVKLLWWQENLTPPPPGKLYFLHQADWLGFLLHDKLGISDHHNSLKLGYDVVNLCYQSWLLEAIKWGGKFTPILPKVLTPGTCISPINRQLSDRFRLRPDCIIRAGTTDSIAAFIASGASSPGEAVTSLGSTLVLKLLSPTAINVAKYGIYSHRFGDLWLTGGASNTGGAILRHFFSDRQLESLSRQINPNTPTLLDYYPLLQPGDRFPINDPNLLPRLEPRPSNDVEFLHGLLNAIARIESQGYQLLQNLGASPLQRVYTAGGGAKNSTWTTIRHHHLRVPVLPSPHTQAAYGTACLAMRGELIKKSSC
ncbi:MAG: FGGY-family carbohydrate kinase [Limnospira sp. PMC 1291.21]|uniref:D-ribulose kinase n=3 Tax=Limnospira TaxID=2596745 RepID=A0A9P1KGK0_9CYAN|nr:MULTISPECIES: FGGY-family carbohydrate kinase [Limnospira]EKD06211.1 carbohydrate kinase FGGY [Arthrospira platensis C1]MDC0836913.1 FGGY-family carbohydrate kinase [Limnoraphis robusta]MDY7054894.1 FGGY-family carbohydrate kinase [Limnospira fusiformis LS22]QJB26750.1 FGGY-family carbohydrate kinase [Limnospira fusiformis SAG 85.79]RAQ42591.1 carbohydrate kinase [Arthrospira sp. O9.13F]